VAKGLWRHELPYARAIMEEYVRAQLTKMLSWEIGLQTNFSVSPGKLGKYFERYLPAGQWQMLLQTCPDGGYEQTWAALEATGDLFRQAAQAVAAHFVFEYPQGEDDRVSAFLRRIRLLPRDAREL
jgi:aminoglycoside 6-adenylyltransferase